MGADVECDACFWGCLESREARLWLAIGGGGGAVDGGRDCSNFFFDIFVRLRKLLRCVLRKGWEHRGSNGEWVILPDPPSKRWEVKIRMARGNNIRDRDTNVFLVNHGDLSVLYAMSRKSQDAEDAVEAPNCHAGEEPDFVSPFVLEFKDDVPIAGCDDQDGDSYVPGEEQLVELLADEED